MVDYSLVLICNNQWKLTEQAINTLNESISLSHKKKGMELIIINNGSKDETKIGVEQIKERLKQEIEIVPIHLTENMGWLNATNIGFSKSRGKIITLLNNDLIFPENWFDGIVRTLEENPSIGAAAPFLSYAMAPAGVGVLLHSLQEIKDFSKKFMEDNKHKIVYTERINGGCLSIKRELFSLIGGNDYWFGLGWGEDVDWSIRACIAGYKIAVVGASFVYHQIGSQTASQYPENLTAALKANNDKLIKKWDLDSGNDLKTIIANTVFSKDKHTFPCRKEDFNPPSPLNNKNANSPKKRIILVADWNNECSQWRNKLAAAKQILNENQDLTIWMPKTYSSVDKIIPDVYRLLHDLNRIHIFYEVPPVDLLKFFNQYDVFWTVENDFVNLYFKYLIEQSTLNIEVD